MIHLLSIFKKRFSYKQSIFLRHYLNQCFCVLFCTETAVMNPSSNIYKCQLKKKKEESAVIGYSISSNWWRAEHSKTPSENMASKCSLSTLFPLQSQLDCDLEDATTPGEKQELVQQFLKRVDEKEELTIPDFQTG